MGKLWVVIKREYLERVRSRWFLIGTLLVPALIGLTFLLPAFFISRSSATSAVRNVIILDASAAGLGDRVARELVAPPATGRLGTDAAGDTTGPRPDVRIVAGAQLAQAESTATQEVMRESGRVGYLVLDDRTTAGMTARYAGRNATSLRDVERIRNAVSQSVMFNQLRQAGADPRMVDAIARTRVQMPTERITERERPVAFGQLAAPECERLRVTDIALDHREIVNDVDREYAQLAAPAVRQNEFEPIRFRFERLIGDDMVVREHHAARSHDEPGAGRRM